MTQLKAMTQNPLKELPACGQSVWYDGLISLDEFQKMIAEDGLRGATTNPAIFEKALSTGENDERIALLASCCEAEEIFKTLAIEAVQKVADLFLPVFKTSGGQDGFVSLEVSPALARDTEGTIRQARELFIRTNRKNVMIKIPATQEGLPAIEAVIAEGIHVNVTLIFSVARYRQVIGATLRGLEKRSAKGGSVKELASVASFFVSRVDSAVDKMLEAKISAETKPERQEVLRNLMGKTAIANSKAAYEEFEKVFHGAAFEALKMKGAHAQRPLWASTGTKNPAYSDVLYVETLIGAETVNTMPPATLAAFRDHGVAAPRIKEGAAQARQHLAEIESLGIRLDAVTAELEKAGVDAFCDSYDKIIQSINEKIK